MYFDFSSQESMHREWEKLGRHLWGKPIRMKPSLGDLPQYLTTETGGCFVGLKRSWSALRAALMDGKPSVAVLRDELMDLFENEMTQACIGAQTQQGTETDMTERWEKCLRVQIEARDVLLDWALVEARINAEHSVSRCLIPVLERVNSIPRISDAAPTCPAFKDAMAVLGYELALYAVACLIEVDAPTAIRNLLEHPFPNRDRYRETLRTALSEFCHHSKFMDEWNRRQKPGWISPLAQRLMDRCTHRRLTRGRLVEAEALLFLVNVLNQSHWYPHTAVYAERGTKFPWFLKAKTCKTPDRLAIVSGRNDWQSVCVEFRNHFQEITKNSHWSVFDWGPEDYLQRMSLGAER
ncbi:MAG: hypothetical protein ABIP20_04415 [Chthoniobacteraceae bacterium]